MENQFQNARKQFQEVAKILDLDQQIIDQLINPKRFIEVNFPVLMDNGKKKVFRGYRTQHNNALGPYKESGQKMRLGKS